MHIFDVAIVGNRYIKREKNSQCSKCIFELFVYRPREVKKFELQFSFLPSAVILDARS